MIACADIAAVGCRKPVHRLRTFIQLGPVRQVWHIPTMLKRLTLFLLYKIAPLASFLVIVFSDRFRALGLAAFIALFLFLLWRGRDYRGNPTLLGIRRDSSFFGDQIPVDKVDHKRR